MVFTIDWVARKRFKPRNDIMIKWSTVGRVSVVLRRTISGDIDTSYSPFQDYTHPDDRASLDNKLLFPQYAFLQLSDHSFLNKL